MPPFTDSIPTLASETAQSQAADAAFAFSPSHPSTLSPAQLLPPETFARFVTSALTTLEELSRTSPPNATERRRAATTLLRYLLGPSPRAPRDRTSPQGGGRPAGSAAGREGATRSTFPTHAPEIPHATSPSSRATSFSVALDGDTRATRPSSPLEIPRPHHLHDAPPTVSQPEGGAEGTCKVPSASGSVHSPHREDAAQGSISPPAENLQPPITDGAPAASPAPFIDRLCVSLRSADTPTRAAEILFDAHHPNHFVSNLPPRHLYIQHAPNYHLSHLLRTREITPSAAHHTTNAFGKPIATCILRAHNSSTNFTTHYQLFLTPPDPPHTTDWSLTDIKRTDTG